MKSFIDDLMRKMTLDEKIGQLNLVAPGGFAITGAETSKNVSEKLRKGHVGGMFGFWGLQNVKPWQEIAVKETRLGIPLIFGLDVIHGHHTIFPIPLALACSWDMAMIEKSARLAAIETAADGVNWVFSPMVDICRDPRWGRIAEGAGEDPYLGSRVAEAMVRGYQGGDLSKPDTVMACVKHFALYGAPDGGKDYNTVDMSRVKMMEYYMPPYRAAVDAGAGSVMTAFNEVDGVPASGNRWLLNDLLRHEWGFDGMVVTDYTSLNEMSVHGMGDLEQVSALAMTAGVDMDMVGEGFLRTLSSLLQQGRVKMEEIDAACRRILEAKQALGLFDDPFRYCTGKNAEKILSAEHRRAAREFAAKSCVLLKNDKQVLPLKKSGTIALIGPLSNDRKNMPGTWAVAGDWKKCVTLLEGMQANAGAAKILQARGANITNSKAWAERIAIYGNNRIDIDERDPAAMFREAVEVAQQADVIVCAIGEAQEMTGEAACRADIGIPPDQRPLLEALVKTGRPLVLVVFAGRPLVLTWEQDHADALLMAWFGGTEAGNGIADVLFGNHNPSGKLPVSFPRHVGQIPVYYNHKMTGRPGYSKQGYENKFTSCYLDIPNEPLYPFGHGLSYTAFSYSPVTLDKKEVTGEGTLKAAVTVTNAGTCAGEETVQLYISDPVANVTRSVKDLKGFQKISLKAGESREIFFTITVEDLKFFNSAAEHVWEPGEFIIHLGGSSAALQSAAVQWKR